MCILLVQIGVVLVAGEAPVKAESPCQVAGQGGCVERRPVGVGLRVAPRVEVQGADNLLAAIGDVRIAAQTVGVHVIEAVHPVAAHAEGGQAVGAIDVVMCTILNHHFWV